MLNFPNAPTLNQIFTVGLASWKWDGVKWQAATAFSISPTAPITVTGSITLPTVARASININNTSGAPIVITLPIAAANDQAYILKDVAGNASTYAIRVLPTTGTIDGNPDFYMFQDYQAAELYWAGGLWGVR